MKLLFDIFCLVPPFFLQNVFNPPPKIKVVSYPSQTAPLPHDTYLMTAPLVVKKLSLN